MFEGLNSRKIETIRSETGSNIISFHKEGNFLRTLKNIVSDPMFILLLILCSIYFIQGYLSEGFTMLGAIGIIVSISIYQEVRSENALSALKKMSSPLCKVIRDSKVIEIPSEDIVLNDIILVEEGQPVPADAEIIESNDLTVDESFLTGESIPVEKNMNTENNYIYLGSNVTSGMTYARVSAIGNKTKLGKLGKSLENIKVERTPLQIEVSRFVKRMFYAGAFAFFIISVYNAIESGDIIHGLMHGLTLAMVIIPEEIPVALSAFMALGALHLVKYHILVKNPKTVETLGSATVICVDKTGTITENKMALTKFYCYDEQKIHSVGERDAFNNSAKNLISTAMWASETHPFDSMEIAIHNAYEKVKNPDMRNKFNMIHEYALSGKPPMMTHVFENEKKERIVACKGAPEGIIKICGLSVNEQNKISDIISQMALEGLRVLGVAGSNFNSSVFPDMQQKFPWNFEGLIGLSDPPKKNIGKVFKQFYDAGIKVKIITGDNAITTNSIAKQTGFINSGSTITGDEVMALNQNELKEKVKIVSIFARMFPEAKLKVVEALKSNGEVVAMTGDGVNDGPALKSAHIGIAMGNRGTEIARQASSLVLLDDDLSNMVNAIAVGRKIYTNLKKAVQYIISIHIPLISSILLPILFGWKYTSIFSPIHIIFLELIMGPTCSVVFENEPLEENTMLEKPRKAVVAFLSLKELSLSIIQGIIISFGAMGILYYCIESNYDERISTTMVFTTLVISNIFLTMTNRSLKETIFKTIKYKNNLMLPVIMITIVLLAVCISVPGVMKLFYFETISIKQLSLCIITAFICTAWFEIYKSLTKNTNKV